jgi:hypothetical protein
MFRPYLPIFGQLFTFRNRRTALDLKSIYFNATALSLYTLKYISLRTKLLRSRAIFLVCAPLVCVFPLVECMSLVPS